MGRFCARGGRGARRAARSHLPCTSPAPHLHLILIAWIALHLLSSPPVLLSGALLRRALRARGQVAYLYAEEVADAGGRPVVRVDVQDDGPGEVGW